MNYNVNILARSRNHCCCGKITVHCVTANYIEILNVAQNAFMANLCRRQL